MTCPNCHEPVQENAKFCPNCGYALIEFRNESETRTNRHRESTTRPESRGGNVFLNYGKNNFLLLIILLIISAGLFFLKSVLGVIALVLILMMYYLRATATNGAKEMISQKLQSNIMKNKTNQSVYSNNENRNYQSNYTDQRRSQHQFNSMLNLLILIASALVTVAADFVGSFIQIDAQATSVDAVSTKMSLNAALNLGGIADKITNTFNLQIGIQGILIAIFYILVALPILVILLAFAGGKFSRFVLSLLTCAIYVGTLGVLYYETIELKKVGITLGLTPGVMFYVAIISSFVMLVYSTRVRR